MPVDSAQAPAGLVSSTNLVLSSRLVWFLLTRAFVHAERAVCVLDVRVGNLLVQSRVVDLVRWAVPQTTVVVAEILARLRDEQQID